jgi:hypothetical protein
MGGNAERMPPDLTEIERLVAAREVHPDMITAVLSCRWEAGGGRVIVVYRAWRPGEEKPKRNRMACIVGGEIAWCVSSPK